MKVMSLILKPEVQVNNRSILKCGSYSTENKLHIYYKDQSDNVAQKIIAVYSDNHVKHTNVLSGQQYNMFDVKPRDSYSGY
jgi:hypothetical protein